MQLSQQGEKAFRVKRPVGAGEFGPYPIQGFFQPGVGDRLEQIVDGLRFKCVNSIMIEGSREDDQRRFLALQHPGQTQTVQPGHFDVQENDIGHAGGNFLDCPDAVVALAHDGDVRMALQAQFETVQRQRFVVHQESANPIRFTHRRALLDREEQYARTGREVAGYSGSERPRGHRTP